MGGNTHCNGEIPTIRKLKPGFAINIENSEAEIVRNPDKGLKAHLWQKTNQIINSKQFLNNRGIDQ